MKRWEIALAVAGAVLVALGALWIRQGELPRHEILLQGGGCQAPVMVVDPPADIKAAGAAILLHGLSANRRLMLYLGESFAGHGIRAYLPDLPGHGDNAERFSFARAEKCARMAVETLMRADSLDPAKTIVLGHSMGGAIAVRMADSIPLAATIAISPAPMVTPQRMPTNLLVFTAQFDVWQLRQQAASLEQAAGGERSDPEDFAQKRAFRLVHVPLATHTSMLDNPGVARESEMWAMQAIFPDADPKTLALNLDLATYEAPGHGRRRLPGALIGLVGIGMMMPLWIAVAARAGGKIEDADAATLTATPAPDKLLVLAEGALGALAAVLVLDAGVPLRFVRLYSADYLASMTLIVAVLLLLLNRRITAQLFAFRPRPSLAAAALGFAAMLAIGAWFNWQITDLWLNAARWVRFGELLPFAFIFCFAEEAALGPVGRGKPRAMRFLVFLGVRFEIWLACVLGYFVLASGQILLPILLVQFGAFSITQGLASDALLRRTGSATAVALFSAILCAWFVAAVFPLT